MPNPQQMKKIALRETLAKIREKEDTQVEQFELIAWMGWQFGLGRGTAMRYLEELEAIKAIRVAKTEQGNFVVVV